MHSYTHLLQNTQASWQPHTKHTDMHTHTICMIYKGINIHTFICTPITEYTCIHIHIKHAFIYTTTTQYIHVFIYTQSQCTHAFRSISNTIHWQSYSRWSHNTPLTIHALHAGIQTHNNHTIHSGIHIHAEHTCTYIHISHNENVHSYTS